MIAICDRRYVQLPPVVVDGVCSSVLLERAMTRALVLTMGSVTSCFTTIQTVQQAHAHVTLARTIQTAEQCELHRLTQPLANDVQVLLRTMAVHILLHILVLQRRIAMVYRQNCTKNASGIRSRCQFAVIILAWA